jgi:hypothetical protein
MTPPRPTHSAVLAAVALALAAAHGCAEGGSLVAGSGSGSGGGGEAPCETGLTRCEGLCVDTRVDPVHCGGCTAACADDQVCESGACAAPPCSPGVEEACYSGAQGTEGVGTCAGGVRTCDESGSAFGSCEGEVVPAAERCDTLEDEDCDGVANNGCVYERCAALPAGAPSGIYALDPDGAGPVEPFSAFCEMEIESGGWTLVASVVDGSYFRDTFCSIACDSSAQVGGCDEVPFTAADTAGDAGARTRADHKSRAYSTVSFKEFLFVDSGGEYASYEISSAPQQSVSDWYPAGLRNWVATGVQAHRQYSYEVKATNVPLARNNCGTLRLSFNVEDSESPVGTSCHESKKGPCWAKAENNGCYWDEAGLSWLHGDFYKGNASTYRLWLVR